MIYILQPYKSNSTLTFFKIFMEPKVIILWKLFKCELLCVSAAIQIGVIYELGNIPTANMVQIFGQSPVYIKHHLPWA